MPSGTVVITGASTGIGRVTALRLAGSGFDVLAGVSREEDGAALRSADGRIEPVIVDVTDADQIAGLARRIVNIGSIGGRLGTPFVGPYSSSKAAVRAISAALRRELRPWKIHVALLEPGALDTPIWSKGSDHADEIIGALPERVRTLYARQLHALLAATRKIGASASPPEAAAEAIEHGLTARRPRTLYTIGREARMQAALHAVLPARTFDALVARAMGV